MKITKQLLNSFVFLFIFSALLFAVDPASLRPSGWVNDFAGIIPPADEEKMASLIGELKQKTGSEIAVVTIKTLEGQELNDFTNTLYNKWGIGEKGKDNGAMILVAVDERRVRIEVGYGLEGTIPDGAAGDIIRNIITPAFKAGDYGAGLGAAAQAIAMKIAAEKGVELTGQYQNTYGSAGELTKAEKLFSFIFLIIMIILFIKNPWLLLLLLTSGRGGGYGGGGFGGGGFGGFGGGSSGGGGASGGW